MIQARLLIIFSLAIFVTAMPNTSKGSKSEVADRGTVCDWAGSSPFCRSNWDGDDCKDYFGSIYSNWYVQKTKKGNCWTGKKAKCCHN